MSSALLQQSSDSFYLETGDGFSHHSCWMTQKICVNNQGNVCEDEAFSPAPSEPYYGDFRLFFFAPKRYPFPSRQAEFDLWRHEGRVINRRSNVWSSLRVRTVAVPGFDPCASGESRRPHHIGRMSSFLGTASLCL